MAVGGSSNNSSNDNNNTNSNNGSSSSNNSGNSNSSNSNSNSSNSNKVIMIVNMAAVWLRTLTSKHGAQRLGLPWCPSSGVLGADPNGGHQGDRGQSQNLPV